METDGRQYQTGNWRGDLDRDDLIHRRDYFTALGSKDRAAYEMALRTHDAEQRAQRAEERVAELERALAEKEPPEGKYCYVADKRRKQAEAENARLREKDGGPEGVYSRPRKTARTTGKSAIYEWSEELREAWAMALAARPVDIGPWVFCNRRGECYVPDDGRRPAGFESVWKRFIKRCVEDPDNPLQEPFAERDLRAKASTDAGSIDRARELLQQADARTTRRWYRRLPERIKPVR